MLIYAVISGNETRLLVECHSSFIIRSLAAPTNFMSATRAVKSAETASSSLKACLLYAYESSRAAAPTSTQERQNEYL